ncbi:MAG: single-stranded DNA-binding protein [Flavobacteriales bacterium]|nr:MAG: single-stranded DNA-binding protein [Flavobacteriales bacterium]
MSNTLNKVTLIGHLGDEVKIHYFDSSHAVGRFPLATHEEYKSRDGNKVKTTEWHNIVVHNKLAELCEKSITKGDKIYCEGRIKTRQWTRDNGDTRYITEIHVHDLIFLSHKKADQKNLQSSEHQKVVKRPEQPDVNTDNPEDDLPF